jgi:tetratricopeptide (TPR) repeat protein
MKMKAILICVLFLTFEIMAINGQKILKRAEIYNQSLEFSKASEQYLEYLKSHENDYQVMALLAENLASSGDLSQADVWYSKIPDNVTINPDFYLKHGDVLKKMGHYKEALEKFNQYKNFNYAVGAHYINSCTFAMSAVKKQPEYELIALPVNSTSSDFGLTFYKNMPVFTSFREDILMTDIEKEIQGSDSGQRTYIYNAQKNRLLFVKGPENKLFNIGPVSFSADGSKCAIIESKSTDGNSFVQYPKASRLLIADVNDKGEIVSYKPFKYNEVGSSINSAHLAFDGSALYFSSDRSGGHGGYDIFVSYFTDGDWTLPTNLGTNINSPGNEITPFLKGNELYFSSDYHDGLGGYDIFVSKVENGVWRYPINSGNGINSSADEYFPAINSMGELYLTTNRLGGKGKTDIYKAFKPMLQSTPEILTDVPPAVNLDDLAAEVQKPLLGNYAKSQALDKKTPSPAFSLPEFNASKVGSNADASLTLAGAYRVAMQEFIPNTEVYFIQLASVATNKPNFEIFKPLLRYGNIYKMQNNNTLKVRLGYFTDRKEAEDILSKVRQKGYKDAFISHEILNTAQMELVLTGTDENSFTDKGNFNTSNPEVAKSYKSTNKYKVRLASYEDPIWFDVNKVKDLGRIEQWTKGGWTIFILAGYNDLEEAKKAQIQALNRGYKTSEVVIDNGGILERLKQN